MKLETKNRCNYHKRRQFTPNATQFFYDCLIFGEVDRQNAKFIFESVINPGIGLR